MALNKEQILTLSYLKKIGVKGIGLQKIFSIGDTIDKLNLEIDSYEDLAELMKGMKEKVIQKVTLSDLKEANQLARRIIDNSNRANIGLVGYYDYEFPDVLRKTVNEEGKLEPPLFLWYRGDLSIAQLPGLAVIGTREATPEGVAGGTYLSGEFAKRGFNIVSGLAVGCDTCGHKGALKVGGKTTAFLANGLDSDSIYPPENKELAEEIVEKGGLLLSEYPIGTPVGRYSLVERDRLQSGLALATLVVQTGVNGGTMHAATATLQAGKPLYAMLFKDDATNKDDKCLGNALLVKKGAKYIKGDDNFDEISDVIKNWDPTQTGLFS